MQIPFFRKKRKAPEYNTNKVYTNNFACKKNRNAAKADNKTISCHILVFICYYKQDIGIRG